MLPPAMEAAALRRSETRLAWITLLINAAMPAVVLTVIVLFFFGWSLYLVARAE